MNQLWIFWKKAMKNCKTIWLWRYSRFTSIAIGEKQISTISWWRLQPISDHRKALGFGGKDLKTCSANLEKHFFIEYQTSKYGTNSWIKSHLIDFWWKYKKIEYQRNSRHNTEFDKKKIKFIDQHLDGSENFSYNTSFEMKLEHFWTLSKS